MGTLWYFASLLQVNLGHVEQNGDIGEETSIIHHPSHKAFFHLNLARLAKNIDDATYHFQTAIDQLRQAEDHNLLIEALIQFGDRVRFHGNHTDARSIYQDALDLTHRYQIAKVEQLILTRIEAVDKVLSQ